MPVPENRPLNIERVHAHMADASTAGSAFAAAPCRGTIIRLGSVIHAAVAGADNVLTSKIAGIAIAHPTWVQAASGSAAGDVSEVIPTTANKVVGGQSIEFISDGAGSGTVPTTFYADIRID